MRRTTPRTTAVLGSLLLAGLAGGLWFGILSPRMSHAAEVEESAAQVQTGNLALLSQLNHLRTMTANAPDVARRAQDLFRTMPSDADLAPVLNEVTQAATQSGIPAEGVMAITPSIPIPLVAGRPVPGQAPAAAQAASLGVHIATMPLSVTVQGTDSQLQGFLSRLQHLDRAFLVTGTQFTTAPGAGGTKPGVQELTVTGTLFVLQSTLPDLVAAVQQSTPTA